MRENKKKVKSYAEKMKIPFPTLLDTNAAVSIRYNVKGVPAHFLIDKQGFLLGRAVGARNWQSKPIQELMRKLIDKK